MADYCRSAPHDALHRAYHAFEYGFPVRDDTVLFERLVLEINQAGLSWGTILRKRTAFRQAYAQFDIARVAAFGEADIARLLSDAGIVRNRRKVGAAIENARRLREIQVRVGSFSAWLDIHHPRAHDEWVALFRRFFVFMGREIVGEFLMSTGYLPGAHGPECPVYPEIIAASPPWLSGPA
ncbi:MAG: DNA-3-methyladenine glycosylase I [Betaproteobacteria bacterium]|nr:DNA-3-methyladenine glycosylase I [Betaproteobacteria bacterium]